MRRLFIKKKLIKLINLLRTQNNVQALENQNEKIVLKIYDFNL